MATTLGIKCRFCGEAFKMESYRMRKAGHATAINTSPSVAFADVAAWGSIAETAGKQKESRTQLDDILDPRD